jgi:hypothetical protein
MVAPVRTLAPLTDPSIAAYPHFAVRTSIWSDLGGSPVLLGSAEAATGPFLPAVATKDKIDIQSPFWQSNEPSNRSNRSPSS